MTSQRGGGKILMGGIVVGGERVLQMGEDLALNRYKRRGSALEMKVLA